MSGWELAVGSALGLMALFALVYLLARRLDNYGVVDIAWSYAFGAAAVAYALLAPGWPVRRALIAALVAIWSLRLGTHLLVRVARHHPEEDSRYVQLRRDWQGGFALKMAGFFQLQALSVAALAAPFLLACLNPAPALHPLELAGAGLWLAALTGEAVADAQLAAFRRDPAHRGQVCDVGLWRYSRHPNYFCEWLIWVAYAVFAGASPWGWAGIFSPACILWLLVAVTGIPMAEKQSLLSKGDAYRRYQRTTSAFVPWPPRRPPAAGGAAP
jgi:steroid 5-alpha reductase family enzyme